MMLQLDAPNRAAYGAVAQRWFAVVLAACSSTGGSTAKQNFDLGMPASNAPPAVVTERATIAVAPISASEWLDSNAIVYRLAYVDIQQPRRYANSQWTGVPAELLMRRLRNKLADQLNVVAEGDTAGATVIKVELEEFDQVFDSAQDSHAVREAARQRWCATGGCWRSAHFLRSIAASHARMRRVAPTRWQR
jgi:cholesterol transport system auxiliary component